MASERTGNRAGAGKRPKRGTGPGRSKALDAARRFDLAMRGINEGVYDWDIANGTIYYSDRVYRVLGMSRRDFRTPGQWRARIHPEDLARYDTALLAHFKGKADRFECDYRFRTREGSWRWARQRGIAARNARGRAIRLIGSIGDITELRRSEEALRQSDERYDFAMRAISEGVYDWDIVNDTVYYSERVREILGLSPDELRTSEDWVVRIHPEDMPKYRAAHVAHFKGQTDRYECDYRYRAKDGTWRWARTHALAMRDGRGRAVRMVGSTGDITELKRAEAALHASEERYALATSAAVEGIYEWDVETGKLYLTERAKAFFSLSAEDLTPAAWNSRIHGEDFAGYRSAIVEHFKGRAPQLQHEYRIADGRGSYKWVLDCGIAVRNAAGRVTKMVGALSDITQRKRAEIELRRARDEAENALERQTATAGILKVISSSPTDVQPVFAAIAENGVRLCNALFGIVFRFDGEFITLAAHHNLSQQELEGLNRIWPMRPHSESLIGRTVLERRVIHVYDYQIEFSKYAALLPTIRSIVSVPMLRGETPIGVLAIFRRELASFTQQQIDLLQTFADQAVIAVENVRLFKELEARTDALTRSVGQLTALGEVGRAISSTLDLDTMLATIVSRAVQISGLDGGVISEYDERTEDFHLRAAENLDEEVMEVLRRAPLRKGEGAIGRTAVTREPTHIPDTLDESYQSRVREALLRTGHRALLAVPMLREDHLIGALVVLRKTPGPFTPEVVELLKTFAAQSAIAIQNARLFREIAEKGRQLEVASRHKSDFLAGMSHELRTPLNAILGFNEMLLGQVYGEVPADMQAPLAQIQTSGKHLLRLINNVLDLAKIEAGRMELALADYSVQDTVESVRSTLRPLAAEKGLEFLVTVPADVPLAYGDSGRITQCLMNLAGNSLKFTKTGRVEISVALKDGVIVYRVADTGIGIAPDKIETIFAEFKQSDATIASEYGGTGLGLSISKKFIEMHGGRIWVESELGKGSAFIFEVPLRYRAEAGAQA